MAGAIGGVLGGSAGGGMLASPWFQMLLGAAGQGQSGQNAGMGALQGLQASSNYNRNIAATQLLENQTRDNELLRKYITANPPGGGPSPPPEQYAPNVGIGAVSQPAPGMLGQNVSAAIPAIQSMMAPPPQAAPPPPIPMAQPNQRAAMPAMPPAAPPSQPAAMSPSQPALQAAPAPQPAAMPPPQPVPQAPQSVGRWKGGGMLEPPQGGNGMMPIFKEALKYPGSRKWALDGILAMNKPGAGTFRPATGAERAAVGAPSTGIAQMGPDGKMHYQAPAGAGAANKPRTAKDANGMLRFIEGPNAGERVFSDVEKERKFDFKDERSLAKEATKSIKPIRDAVTSIKQIKKSLERTGPFSDIASLYGLIKAIDPGSVVREGEVHIVTAAQSAFQQLQGQVQKLAGDGFLTPALKANISETVEDLASIYEQQYSNFTGHYTDISKQYSFDPGRVIGAPVSFQGTGAAPPPPEGFTEDR